MQQYIMDDRVILAIQGLRSVKKRNHISSLNANMDRIYGIIWNYKGSDGFMDYNSEEQRDKIFNEIAKLIEERQNPIRKLEIKKGERE